jgi:hypothetical protein
MGTYFGSVEQRIGKSRDELDQIGLAVGVSLFVDPARWVLTVVSAIPSASATSRRAASGIFGPPPGATRTD